MSRKATRGEPARNGLLSLVAGSLAWSGLMATSAAFSMWRLAWQNETAFLSVVVLFAVGGLLAYGPAVLVATFLVRGRRRETRFAAHFVALTTSTIGATAFCFALYYRLYYASWHGPPLTIEWIFQFVFTTAAAVYHFAVLGIRLFLPVGLPALLAVSLWHAARSR